MAAFHSRRLALLVVGQLLALGAWLPVARSAAASGSVASSPTADADVSQTAPTTNFGSQPTLGVDSATGTGRRAFLSFTVPTIPAGAVMTHAFLELTPTTASGKSVTVAPVAGTWTESTVTWANQPPISSSFTDQKAVKSGHPVSLDVTAAVVGNGTVSLGVQQVGTSTSTTVFSSREGTAPPQLTVSYLLPGAATHPCAGATAPTTYDHVIWIVMENKTYSQVIGSPAAPYTTELAGACGTAPTYLDAGKFPSLPNYIAMTSGATNGFTTDLQPASQTTTADNLFRQVRTAGGTEKSYAESMPSNCYLTNAGSYAVRHVPAAYYVGGDDRTACQNDAVPLGAPTSGAFAADLANGTLPNFALITPNVVDDGHSGPSLTAKVEATDLFLSTWLPMILESPTYQAGRTAVLVVWDEDTSMPNVWIAPSVPPGTVSTTASGHYSLLRTTEEMLGVSSYLLNAASATSMRGPLGL